MHTAIPQEEEEEREEEKNEPVLKNVLEISSSLKLRFYSRLQKYFFISTYDKSSTLQ